MLMEGLVGITALIAASSLFPADYYQINLTPAAFADLMGKLKLEGGHLGELARLVGEPRLEGGPAAASRSPSESRRSSAGIPGLRTFMGYFYHFVIMFEALFVLTTIDTGTRIARFLVQEFLGRVHPKMGRTDWMPGTILASFLVVAGWSYFIYTGTIQTLWPMFGVANQLLAVVALAVGTTVLVNEGRGRIAWVTLGPMLFVGTTTLTGGFLSIRDIFVPMWLSPKVPADSFKGLLNSGLTVVMMTLVVLILMGAVPLWFRYWKGGRRETLEMLRALPRSDATGA